MNRFVPLVSVVVAASAMGCSNQGEGDRCNLDNGSEDCESGLICKSLQSLSGAGVGAICCPEDNAAVAACRRSFDFNDNTDFSEDTSTNGADAAAGVSPDAAKPAAAKPDAALTEDAATAADAGEPDASR